MSAEPFKASRDDLTPEMMAVAMNIDGPLSRGQMDATDAWIALENARRSSAAVWYAPDDAPFGVPLWGYRLDPGKPWVYGVIALVERSDDEKPAGWFLVEDGDAVDAPVLWTVAHVPARPAQTSNAAPGRSTKDSPP